MKWQLPTMLSTLRLEKLAITLQTILPMGANMEGGWQSISVKAGLLVRAMKYGGA